MRLMDKLYEFMVFVQLAIFFIFIIENYASLDEITYSIEIGTVSEELTINLYALLPFLIALIGVVILTAVQVMGSGISEFGSSIFSRFAFLITYFAILTSSSVYYLLSLGIVGVMIEFIFLIIWVFKGISMLDTTNNDEGI